MRGAHGRLGWWGHMGAWWILRVLPVLVLVGCSPYSAAWRTMDGVITARDQTAVGLATWGRAELARCTKLPQAEHAKCLEPASQALTHWRDDARPAINTALNVAAASIQIAEKAGNKKLDWLALVKPGACALLRVVKLWGHKLPAGGASVYAALGTISEVYCAE